MKRSIFVTGGHISPAIAVIGALKQQGILRTHQLFLIGREYVFDGQKVASQEKNLIALEGDVRFLPLTTGRLTRGEISVDTVMSLFKFPCGLFQAFVYCIKYKPNVIVSFGGYIALPVAIVGKLMGARVLMHEQTRVVGLSNQIIARFADVICTTWPDQRVSNRETRVVCTGLPIRKEILQATSKKPPYVSGTQHPLLYVTGGSTGAVSMNDLLFPIVQKLVEKYTVVHQAGELSMSRALAIQSSLPETTKKRYIPRAFIDASDVSWLYHHASIVIARSGANTTVELAVIGVPSILIPLPWSSGGEQKANAQYLEKLGGTVVFDQQTGTPDMLLQTISQIGRRSDTHTRTASGMSQSISNASGAVAREVIKLIQ